MHALGRYSVSSFLSAALTVASIGLSIALALAVLVTLFSPWIDLGGSGELGIPVAFTVDGAALHLHAPSLGDARPRLTKIRGQLQFAAPTRRTIVAPLLTVIAMLAIAVWVTDQLRRLFRTLREGHPFDPANARRVQRVGWAVILAESVRAMLTFSAQAFARSNFIADGIHFVTDLDFNQGVVFSGVVILVLAEVFRAGTQLSDDQSLTI